MGISASQARLLTLTSRLRDIEYKQQQLANTKMRFSVEQDEVSAKYSKALDKQKIQFKDYNTGEYKDLTLNNLYDTEGGCRYALYDKEGHFIGPGNASGSFARYMQLKQNVGNDPNWIYEAIESGEFFLKVKNNNDQWVQCNAGTDTNLDIVRDDSDYAKAKADYDAAMRKISNKEKRIDSEVTKLNNEYQAMNTEYDSVKQIISDNSQNSFKLFG